MKSSVLIEHASSVPLDTAISVYCRFIGLYSPYAWHNCVSSDVAVTQVPLVDGTTESGDSLGVFGSGDKSSETVVSLVLSVVDDSTESRQQSDAESRHFMKSTRSARTRCGSSTASSACLMRPRRSRIACVPGYP